VIEAHRFPGIFVARGRMFSSCCVILCSFYYIVLVFFISVCC
jgi:hypothetical protein